MGYNVDEELFVGIDSRVQHNGQPCGIIIANRMDLAYFAATKVKITYKKLKSDVVMPLLCLQQNEQQNLDDNVNEEELSADGSRIVKGIFHIGEQFHFSMEPQTALCTPSEDGGINVHSASQWMDLTQIAIAQCLGLPENKINVEVRRLGGAFGAKISRNVQIACASALACYLLQKPVRLVLEIESNMKICGKRNACTSKYKIHVDSKTGEIRSLFNEFTHDFGCSPNEGDIMQMIASHSFKNCYEKTDKWKIEGKKIYSSTASTTWCRAPGTLEGIASIENIIDHIAFETKIDPVDVKLSNIPDTNPLKQIFTQFIDNIGK